jgi:hypothetical protein
MICRWVGQLLLKNNKNPINLGIMHPLTPSARLALAITASILTACQTQAYDLTLSTNFPPISVHGFGSQGFLYSSDYNYLAPDTKNGSFQFTEMGLNLSMNPFPRTRIAVQGFDFDVGTVGQYDPFLDYALIEYTLNDQVGIRAGRIRRPSGIYNAIQDIDLARTFVLLPQGMYDARWRDWSAGLDGGELFGEFSLHQAGSLSYEAYAGMVSMEENGGVARYVQDGGTTLDTIDSTPIVGGQLWYNTPLDGLRIGAAVSYLSNFGYTVTTAIPAAFGGPDLHQVGNVLMQQFSVEYLWKQWTFQAEYSTYNFTGHSYLPAAGNAYAPPSMVGNAGDRPETWYVAASRRLNKLIEVGAYYTQFKDNSAGSWQNDAALSLRFDLTDWWIFKVEGHCIDGTGLLRDDADNPIRNNNDTWFMLAVKTTLSF